MWQSGHSSHWPSIPYNSSMNVGETWDLLRCPKKKRKMSKVSVLNIYAKIFLKLPETIDYVSFVFLILAIWLMYSLSFLLLGEIGLKLPKDPLCSLVSYYICVLSKQWGVFGAFLLKKTLPPVRKMALKRTIRVKQSSILVRDQFKDGTKLKNPKQNCKDNSLWIDHFQDSKLILFFFNIRDQSSHFEVLTCSHCFPLALWKSFLFALHSLTSLNLSVPSC